MLKFVFICFHFATGFLPIIDIKPCKRFGDICCPILLVVDPRPSVTVESRERESEARLTLLSVSVLSKLSALVVCRAGGGMELADMLCCVMCYVIL